MEKLSLKYGAAIALFPPSPLGLYDMVGNPQWVNDWYAANYYAHSGENDPAGPSAGGDKMLRSSDNARYSMTMHRWKDKPSGGAQFRCAVNSASPLN